MCHVLVSGSSLSGFTVSSVVSGPLGYGPARAIVARLISSGVPVVFVGSAGWTLDLV